MARELGVGGGAHPPSVVKSPSDQGHRSGDTVVGGGGLHDTPVRSTGGAHPPSVGFYASYPSITHPLLSPTTPTHCLCWAPLRLTNDEAIRKVRVSLAFFCWSVGFDAMI